MKSISAALALVAACAMGVGAQALPLSPAAAGRAVGAGQPANFVVEVHHKPGHVGGRGRHLGWYKKNRGKHKGWRRWR